MRFNILILITISIGIFYYFIFFTLASVINFQGSSYNFFNGEKINGTVTYISLEEPENNISIDFINGNWNLQVQYNDNKIQNVLIIVNDSKFLGYNNFLIKTKQTSLKQACNLKSIIFENFFFDISSGKIITPKLSLEIEGTPYKNIILNTTQQTNIINVCLIPGKIYKINMYASDSGDKNGFYSILYPSK